MEARELRIGNWVEYKGHNVQWDYSDFVDGTAKRLSKPIPLTEEWLEKFGVYNPRTPFTFEVAMMGGVFFAMLNGMRLREVRYVHQLQNLYFALTGKELEVKEKTPQK